MAPWTILTTSKLAEHHLAALATDRIGLIRIEGLLSQARCAAALEALKPGLLTQYDPKRYPVNAYRFGPALNEYKVGHTLRADYWRAASETQIVWDASLGHLRLPETIRTALGSAGAHRTFAASIAGRNVCWPILREIPNGTLLHWDDVNLEYPSGLFDQAIQAQFALNLFLTTPLDGGELRLWRRQWQPEDDTYRLAFGYDSALLAAPPDISIAPLRGDALLFSSRHYHDVTLTAEGRRVSLSLFVGACRDGLAMWA